MNTAFPIKTDRALNRRQIIIASGDATVSFTDLDTSAFFYEVDLIGITSDVDSDQFNLRTSSNNGVSYDSGASDYVYLGEARTTSTPAASYAFTSTHIELDAYSFGTGANEVQDLTLGIYNPSDTNFTSTQTTVCGRNLSPELYAAKTYGLRQSAADVDAIQFFMTSGNTSGKLILREYLI